MPSSANEHRQCQRRAGAAERASAREPRTNAHAPARTYEDRCGGIRAIEIAGVDERLAIAPHSVEHERRVLHLPLAARREAPLDVVFCPRIRLDCTLTNVCVAATRGTASAGARRARSHACARMQRGGRARALASASAGLTSPRRG